MAVSTFSLRVADIRKQSKDAIEIQFDLPTELKAAFQYNSGQYLTIELNIDGKRQMRCYSLCSSPIADNFLAVGVKRVKDGIVSNWLNDNLNVGDEIQVLPPAGRFFYGSPKGPAQRYLLFAGGSGITPIYSMVRTMLKQEPDCSIYLLYANQNEASIMFHSELSKLVEESGGRLHVHHQLDDAGTMVGAKAGRIDGNQVGDILNSFGASAENSRVYLCGPAPFMDVVCNGLNGAGYPEENINQEFFVIKSESKNDSPVNESEENQESMDGTAKVKAILDGEEFEFKVQSNETILEAALEAEIDPPYACMSASCSTCRAKVLSGKVEMDDREILSDSEIEEGFILTCQAHPTTSEVTISYDEY